MAGTLEQHQWCPACAQIVPLSDFHKDKGRPTGLRSHCKKCTNKENRENHERNVQKHYLKTQTVQPNEMKLCKACGVSKLVSAFALSRQSPQGKYPWCKTCSNIRHQARRDALKAACSTEDKSETTSALYVMRNPLLPSLVKVGQSSDAVERAIQLSKCHPFDIEICYEYSGLGHLESTVHDRMRPYRFTGAKACKGREWFEMQSEQADGIIRGVIAEWELAQKTQQSL
jgi:hypothetical protein